MGLGRIGQGIVRVRFKGQATVECAFLIPVVLLLLMMLIQPGILLYDRMVMKAAAAEGCRLIATSSDSMANMEVYESAVKRHLGSIPEQENFHVHKTGCSWSISFEGDETTSTVKVIIENQIEPLPFFDFVSKSLGLTNDAGNFVQRVEMEQEVRASWVQESPDGPYPNDWVHRDDDLLEGVR